MPDNPDLLETETVVHNLLEELKELEAATKQIEDIKNCAQTIQESAYKIVSGTIELVDMGKKVLGRIEEVKLKECLDSIEKLGTDAVANSKTILEKIEEVKFKERFDEVQKLGTDAVANSKTILGKIEEVKFKERFDKIEELETDAIDRLEKQNAYLITGFIGLLGRVDELFRNLTVAQDSILVGDEVPS